MIQLTPVQWQALHDGLVDAFDRDGLAELVRFNLPYRLDVLVNAQKALEAVVFDLMEALDQRGELESLLRGAVKARPKNEPLIALCRTVAPQVFTPVDTRGLITQVTAGLEALTDLSAAPEVWAKVGESQAIFRVVMVQTGILAAYKSLHDGLHNLQMRLGAIEAAAGTFTTANRPGPAAGAAGRLPAGRCRPRREPGRRACRPSPRRTTGSTSSGTRRTRSGSAWRRETRRGWVGPWPCCGG